VNVKKINKIDDKIIIIVFERKKEKKKGSPISPNS